MEKTILIRNIRTPFEEAVILKGWLHNIRISGKIAFLILRDGTGFIQCVISKNTVGNEKFETYTKISQESSIQVYGTIREDKRSPIGFEMDVQSIEILQMAEDYPISLKEHGVGFLSNIRHLWLRSPKQHALLVIRDLVALQIREFLHQEGFTCIDSPILTGSAAEGTTTLFELDYFGDKAFLSQTGQLYQEAAAMAFGRTYCFGPTFRAEKSKTRRHLTEFWMVEPEIAYCDFEQNMDIQERMVLYLIRQCLDNAEEELKTLERDLNQLTKIKSPFPRVKYEEILQLLNKHDRGKQWGDDITGLDETIISNEFEQPVFITHFPVESKAFYMKADPTDAKVVLAADLMAPEGYGEIIGGSQRIDSQEDLLAKMNTFGLNQENYQWYIDLRRFGSVPHSGFGMGLERFVGWMGGIEHIREAIPFPRTIEKIYP
jgi:asparaginyl-tRNA synthetase